MSIIYVPLISKKFGQEKAVVILKIVFFHTVMCQKDADGLANNVDNNQTGSTLFAQTCISEKLRIITVF